MRHKWLDRKMSNMTSHDMPRRGQVDTDKALCCVGTDVMRQVREMREIQPESEAQLGSISLDGRVAWRLNQNKHSWMYGGNVFPSGSAIVSSRRGTPRIIKPLLSFQSSQIPNYDTVSSFVIIIIMLYTPHLKPVSQLQVLNYRAVKGDWPTKEWGQIMADIMLMHYKIDYAKSN